MHIIHAKQLQLLFFLNKSINYELNNSLIELIIYKLNVNI